MNFQIGEISRFFHLPASTLRYWEDQGVITPQKNKDNQYRTYTVSDLMTISDIIFYKSLGIPLRNIRDMEGKTPDLQKQLFEQKIKALEDEQELLLRRMEKLHRHIEAVQTLEALRQTAYQETDIDTACIVSFELIEQEKLLHYIENPYLYSRVQRASSLRQEQRGLTVPSEFSNTIDESQIIWRKRSNRYIAFLMREEVTEGFPNDLPKHLKHIQSRYKTGDVISRFCSVRRKTARFLIFTKPLWR